MAADLKHVTDFLVELGIDKLPHTEKTYLGHLIAVHRDLKAWGCDDDVCLGGMFHSIYGTEMFQGFTLPLERRGEVRDLIGPRAEHLGYLNCAMDRPVFDANFTEDGGPREDSPFRYVDRITGEKQHLSRRDFDDLARIHLCDWLEQVPRCEMWDYRREPFAAMAVWLGGAAEAAYEGVFSRSGVSPDPMSAETADLP